LKSTIRIWMASNNQIKNYSHLSRYQTISTQKFKLLDEALRYDLYYSLTHPLKWKLFGLETCTDPHYIVLNFYQINEDGEIRTRDRLVIKTLIPCQRTISTQKLKLLGKILKYNLYYSLTVLNNSHNYLKQTFI
jgi:hypothetical protein